MLTDLAIAKVCHEANRAYCSTIGDDSQLPWDEAPGGQRESAAAGVKLQREDRHLSARANHDSWLAEKAATGWVYGEEKDTEAKTHPCIVPFENLPPVQQAKDYLFRDIVHALTCFDISI